MRRNAWAFSSPTARAWEGRIFYFGREKSEVLTDGPRRTHKTQGWLPARALGAASAGLQPAKLCRAIRARSTGEAAALERRERKGTCVSLSHSIRLRGGRHHLCLSCPFRSCPPAGGEWRPSPSSVRVVACLPLSLFLCWPVGCWWLVISQRDSCSAGDV